VQAKRQAKSSEHARKQMQAEAEQMRWALDQLQVRVCGQQ